MDKIVRISFLLLIIFSCKKDKVPPPCAGVSMTGDRELFVGKWRWYKTLVVEWFDVGPSNYYEYTPQNQGYTYYFVITVDGIYKGYRNDTLIHDFLLSTVDFEKFNGSTADVMEIFMDCNSDKMDLTHFIANTTADTIQSLKFPLQFNEQQTHLYTGHNHFVRE